jgi:Ser/Thr protein kinase RdoA (MazF antagonist)
MKRNEIVNICNRGVLDIAAKSYGFHKDALKMIADYEGAANLVYEYELFGKPMILRITYTSNRTIENIQAELHFINYLAEHGVRVSVPVPIINGELIESIHSQDIPFHLVSFVRGKGMRVPDNGYRYRMDAPIEEYFRNWGRVLGQMHALAKDYQAISEEIKRPEWFKLHQSRLDIESLVPDRLDKVRQKIHFLFMEIKSLPRTKDSFGLIHGDFNDGNFTVDYDNGNITVFDFDDSGYFWFIYELASAWEGGIGRVMFRKLDERKAFMQHYMEQVLEGYSLENTIPCEWLARLPLFIKLVQVEELLHYLQYIDGQNEEIQAGINYKIKCIEEDIPYMGFFDSIYSPENPFSL